MRDIDLVGPQPRTDVVVFGRRVPFLQGWEEPGGRIYLEVDDRFGFETSVQEAERLIPWLADAIAVALGYTCHPHADKEPNLRAPFPRVHRIDEVGAE